MSKGWIIAISVILAVVLLGGTVFLIINYSNRNGDNMFNFGGYNYKNSEKYSIGNAEIDVNIDNVKIDWINGRVSVIKGDKLKFSETDMDGNSIDEEREKLRYYIDGNTLDVRFCDTFSAFEWKNLKLKKKLIIEIPEKLFSSFYINTVSASIYAENLKSTEIELNSVSGEAEMDKTECEALTMNTVSGNIYVSNSLSKKANIESVSGECNINTLSTKKLDMETTSGKITGENITCTELDVNSTSGIINITGKIDKIDAESTSGALIISSESMPQEVDMETVSGNIILTIPENEGFTISYSKVSGNIECEFSCKFSGKKITYGNGTVPISLETVSGNMLIKKA